MYPFHTLYSRTVNCAAPCVPQVSRSDCKEGASGIVGGANWAPIVALVSLLVLVVLVQCLLHYICPVRNGLLAAVCGASRR